MRPGVVSMPQRDRLHALCAEGHLVQGQPVRVGGGVRRPHGPADGLAHAGTGDADRDDELLAGADARADDADNFAGAHTAADCADHHGVRACGHNSTQSDAGVFDFRGIGTLHEALARARARARARCDQAAGMRPGLRRLHRLLVEQRRLLQRCRRLVLRLLALQHLVRRRRPCARLGRRPVEGLGGWRAEALIAARGALCHFGAQRRAGVPTTHVITAHRRRGGFCEFGPVRHDGRVSAMCSP
mmetsp:Transcript_100820/g.289782  ORF Transcript_100820/g.289782 Transcript_100820/m.289782 type:complete len:244 (-) Transcript_100820:138-869(-)